MGCETGQYDAVCKGEFGELHAKLDRLDEAIRGNGKPGLQRRLDRLEMAAAVRSRLAWLAVGSGVTFAATAVWKYVFAG